MIFHGQCDGQVANTTISQAVWTTTTIRLVSKSVLNFVALAAQLDPTGVLGLELATPNFPFVTVLFEELVVKTLTSLLLIPNLPRESFMHISFLTSSLKVLEEGDSNDSIAEEYMKGANADEDGVGG